jgi:uncharacterized membrane protein YhaH (DUF805 family)
MSTLHLLFGFEGRIGRPTFIVAFLTTVAAVALAIYLGELSLPAMAALLAPRGINAALVLNAIQAVLGGIAVWAALALAAKRLHDRGRSGWWGAAAILPLVALAILNDALFLVTRTIVLPAALQLVILVACGALGVWVLVEAAVLSGGGD